MIAGWLAGQSFEVFAKLSQHNPPAPNLIVSPSDSLVTGVCYGSPPLHVRPAYKNLVDDGLSEDQLRNVGTAHGVAHGNGLSDISGIFSLFCRVLKQPLGRQTPRNKERKRWNTEEDSPRRDPGRGTEGNRYGRSHDPEKHHGMCSGEMWKVWKRMEGHRRRRKEGRDHGRPWNLMEGKEDPVRTPWNLMESHRTSWNIGG